jgi:hypothetical protein
LPGPGNYEYKSHFATKYKGYNFGRESRVRDEANRVPGPGSYSYEKAVFKYESKQQPSYGFGSRLSEISGAYTTFDVEEYQDPAAMSPRRKYSHTLEVS